MKCPYCRATTTDVFNTRSTKFGTQIWRRRRCLACEQSFTTYEQPDLSFLKVAKLTQKKPLPYIRARLLIDVYSAFNPLTIDPDTIEAVTSTIEAKLLDLKLSEVSASQIEELALTTLKHYDTTAFMRYLTSQKPNMSAAQLRAELKK